MDTAREGTGWFWDMVAGRGDPPPAPRTLGFELTSIAPEGGAVEGSFEALPGFGNMMDGVQGGFLAAMLDTLVSCALLSTLPGDHLAPTLSLTVNYLRPVPLGRVTGRGRVVRRGKTVAFLAGELVDADGELATTATATARIVGPR